MSLYEIQGPSSRAFSATRVSAARSMSISVVNRNYFLTDIQVAKAADLAHRVRFAGLLFEAPNQQHLT